MASLYELKKRMSSITTAGQLANAMKTVSAAKFSETGRLLAAFSKYTSACSDIASYIEENDGLRTVPAQDAPDLYVIFGSPRSLCGNFNSLLFPYVEKTLNESEGTAEIYSVGKTVSAWLKNKGCCVKEYPIGDVPDFDSCLSLIDDAVNNYRFGKIRSVNVIYMKMINAIVQEPNIRKILPAVLREKNDSRSEAEVLFFPDKTTISASFFEKSIKASIYEAILESAASLHAATLNAMRTACDNAKESFRALEIEINQKRQAIITSGVIETSADLFNEGDDL
ncbi:MAG: F0F1 ATP synthase subunit gamma [Firmicutes bacterium]|nr:F0F1 ATP synthase subunit gamma [Bacillota bacterium]